MKQWLILLFEWCVWSSWRCYCYSRYSCYFWIVFSQWSTWTTSFTQWEEINIGSLGFTVSSQHSPFLSRWMTICSKNPVFWEVEHYASNIVRQECPKNRPDHHQAGHAPAFIRFHPQTSANIRFHPKFCANVGEYSGAITHNGGKYSPTFRAISLFWLVLF